MTKTTERENFIAEFTRENLTLAPHQAIDTARKLLRYAATLQRLSEAQCNGDYPADNGERKVVPCSRCESLWVRSTMVKDYSQPTVNHFVPLICKDCRTSDLVTALVSPLAWVPRFNGDPRGCVLVLYRVGTKAEDIESGRARGLGVPS